MKQKDENKNKPNMILAMVLISILVISAGGYVVYKMLHKEKPWSDYLDKVLENYPDCPEGSIGLRDKMPDKFGYLPRKMFCQLPAMDDEFVRMMVVFSTGKLTEIEELGPEFWAQPEFQISYEGQQVPLLQNPDPNRIGVTVPAVTPADSIATVYPGTQFDMYTTVRSSTLGSFYLGLKPAVIYPKTYKDKTQNVSATEQYFEVSFNPDEFVLEPSWPVYRYNITTGEGYVRLLKVSIEAKPNTPPGEYFIGVNFASPSEEYNHQMLRKYLNLYTSSIYGGISRPWYVIAVTVVADE